MAPKTLPTRELVTGSANVLSGVLLSTPFQSTFRLLG